MQEKYFSRPPLPLKVFPSSHTPTVALEYLKLLLPPDRVLRFLESRLNLLGRIPHYVSVDQKTYGRYGVLPSVNNPVSSASAVAPNAGGGGVGLGGSAAGSRTWTGGSGRLGP